MTTDQNYQQIYRVGGMLDAGAAMAYGAGQ